MGRSAARGGQRQVSGKGHGLPRRDGGAWQVRAIVPALRDEGAADPVRVERDELLPAVPDGGKLLADRALSRLLREDWPRTLEELEERKMVAEVGVEPTRSVKNARF